ncbi:7-carboxy-7-deazaguanine synthase QueE [Verrucomicrobia bacterium]|nr:7-carboxy-7-deazaguanine synthase QueE [Verrucomicrobiota bacterium]
MFVSEIFYSIQGEGELAGVPSVFIRVSGCNLRCKWCDTKYASWYPEGEEMSIDEVLTDVEFHNAKHVVLTGGEPMIARGIHDLARRIQAQKMHVTIETAGTVLPEGIPCDLASISPKLKNANPGKELSGSWRTRHDKLRWAPEIAQEWTQQYEYQLKFVVSHPHDMQEVEEYLQAIRIPVPPHKVLIMPEGKDIQEIKSHTDIVVGICKKSGYRFCNRLHVDLFGNTRGT